jgi:hypothetical protein
MTLKVTRREFAFASGAALLAPPTFAQNSELLTRAIPGSGERLPAVGLGTAQVFDTNDEATRQKAAAVLQALIAGGGRLVDTSSVYGDSEAVLGDVVMAGGLRERLFVATKLESPNAAELKRSQTRLKDEKLDLLQFHNVRDPQQSLAQFKDWKAQGLCRTLASRPRGTAILAPSKQYFCARSPISCRSTIRSTTAKPKSAFCRQPPR